MRYRVYGLDGISKAPRGPLVVDADNEEAARALAREQGMQAEAVEPVDAPTPPPGGPPRPAAEPATSREQLRRLGRVAEAYGFRLLVIGCLVATLVLAVRINSRLSEIQSQVDNTRSEVKDIDRQVEAIRIWMPRR